MSGARTFSAFAAVAAMSLALPALGEEIKIGLAAEPSAADPHYQLLTPNEQLKKHIFESMTGIDNELRLKPVLAVSWKALNSKTWEFKLRKDVKFHDGSPFTAQDVIYSLCRMSKVVNSPAPFTTYTRQIAGATAADPYTLIIETSVIHPLLPEDMAKIGIISAKLNNGEKVVFDKNGCSGDGWPETRDFNNGRLAIGTGPYQLNKFAPGNAIVLNRNEQYWGVKPHWTKVTFRPLLSDSARVAALLAGEVDMIEAPPTQDVIRVQADPRFTIARYRSARVIFLRFDIGSAVNPAVKGETKNPFKDKRVREAVSRAIDRFSIAHKVMGGFAQPAWQLLYTSQDYKIAGWYDQEKARALLAQAGYPNGFELTLSGTRDRYVNDEKILQSIAKMLSAVGIKTTVEAMQSKDYFAKRKTLGVWMGGYLASSGELSTPLRSLMATPNKENGFGTVNFSGYANPALDTLLGQALETMDEPKRRQLLQQASDLGIEDFGIVPIHYEVNLWAMKKGIDYAGRWDQETSVPEIKVRK
jgi:peptide/nickel transport system substrate-binding protein